MTRPRNISKTCPFLAAKSLYSCAFPFRQILFSHADLRFPFVSSCLRVSPSASILTRRHEATKGEQRAPWDDHSLHSHSSPSAIRVIRVIRRQKGGAVWLSAS